MNKLACTRGTNQQTHPALRAPPGRTHPALRAPLRGGDGAQSPPGRDDAELLWHVEASSSAESVVYQAAYAGPALEPGRRYKSMFFMTLGQLEPRSNELEPTRWQSFEAVDLLTYIGIAADLSAIEAELEAEAADQEEVALARAKYFSSKDLLADAVHEVFSVSDPSDELLAARADLIVQVCN